MIIGFFVRLKGLEPPRLSAPDPKSGAATNYATTAKALQRYEINLKTKKTNDIFSSCYEEIDFSEIILKR